MKGDIVAKRKDSVIIFPGSFNPLHKGHVDIMYKVSHLANFVVLAIGQNPEKKAGYDLGLLDTEFKDHDWIKVKEFSSSLPEFVETMSEGYDVVAIVRGLRNTIDFTKEQAMLYTYEDLGLNTFAVPIFYVISNRDETHISSTAEREKKRLIRG